MHRRILALTSFAALAVLITGCAGTPPAPSAAAADTCAELRDEIARADAAKHAADEKRGDAWKAVIPFAVAARYASGKAAAGEAARHRDALAAESTRRGCTD
jgi:hypothetical protein